MSTKSIGERISHLRKMNNMSQFDLAEELGVARTTISRLELDMYVPSSKLIESLCELFHVNMAYLLHGTAKSNNEFISELNSAIDTLQMIRRKWKQILNYTIYTSATITADVLARY